MKTKKKVVWKIRWMMLEAGIHTATALKKRLDEIGYDITTAYAARIVNEIPNRLSIDLLNALINVFDCEPGDLLASEIISEDTGGPPEGEVKTSSPRKIDAQASSASSTAKKRLRVTPLQVVGGMSVEALLGPKLRPMPNPYEEKS